MGGNTSMFGKVTDESRKMRYDTGRATVVVGIDERTRRNLELEALARQTDAAERAAAALESIAETLSGGTVTFLSPDAQEYEE